MDIGAIAASKYSRKLDLIGDIILASAWISIAFPPILIDVIAEGKMFDEMRVDGGTGSQVFVYTASVGWRNIMKKFDVTDPPHVYVFHNSFLHTDYSSVPTKIIPIAARAISSLIYTQEEGSLFEIYLLCARDGNDFNLAYISHEFTEGATEPFDQKYMGQSVSTRLQSRCQGTEYA